MLEQIKTGLTRAAARQRGASGIEYALIAAMVAVVLVAFVPTISQGVTDIFKSIESALTE